MVLDMIVYEINQQFVNPFDLRSLYPDFMALITNVFINPRVSPFYQDEFIYLGLTYFTDPWTMTTVSQKATIDEKITKEHGTLFYQGFLETYQSYQESLKKQEVVVFV